MLVHIQRSVVVCDMSCSVGHNARRVHSNLTDDQSGCLCDVSLLVLDSECILLCVLL